MLGDLFLAKKQIESSTEFKYALLRSQLAVLLAAICIVYIFIDVLSGVAVYLLWYFVAILASILVLYLNHTRKYLVSSIVLLLTANMLVFLIASLEDSQGGAFFYFVATSTIALVVFNPLNKYLGVVFVGLSLLLAGYAYFGEGLPIEAPKGGESYEKISFTVNFTLGLVSSILVLIFVMNRNRESESILLDKQKELLSLADELEKSKNLYALALEGTAAGIYEWEIDEGEIRVSTRFKNLLGYSDEDALDLDYESYKSMIHKDIMEVYMKNVNIAIEHGSRYQNEIQIRMKNGSYRWFSDSGIVSIQHGVAKLAVGSIIDINNRKIAEEQIKAKNTELEKANEELDRFVYRASHDMRAPLSTLLGLLNLAKTTKEDGALEEYHGMMTNRIYTMEGFIKEVTDYSRNARLEIINSNVKITDILEEVRVSLEFLAAEAQIQIEIKADSGLTLNVDKSRMKVVISNIVFNAIKYSDKNKESRFVKITVSTENELVVISVSDNGIGIPRPYQEKVFDMFFRATEKSEGSGLGLYIVKETLDRLKGSIICQSQEFEGTTFTVRIPKNYETVSASKAITDNVV